MQCLSCWMYAPLTLDFRNRAPHTYRIVDGVSKVKAGACTSSVIPSGHMLNRCFHTSPKKRSKHDAPCYVITALHLKNNTRINQKRATPITHPGSLLNSDDSTEHTSMMHPDNSMYKFMKIRLNSARTTKQMEDPRTYSYACYADDTSLQRDRTLTPFNKRKAFVLIFMLAASAQNTIVFTFPS